MKRSTVYLAFCVLGTLLPWGFFVPFLSQHGLDLSLFFVQLNANPISRFFSADVAVSALVLLYFCFTEGRRLGIRFWWLPVPALFTVGVSLGLPLFLWQRERQLERTAVDRGVTDESPNEVR